METNYKRTVAGSVGAGVAAVFNASGRQYYILEHKTESLYHHAGESQKIIVDQVELGRDSACQVRFDESFETVSRRHAAIVKEGENWKLIPLSQTNSTLVNGQPIYNERVLVSGDEIRLSSRGPRMGFIVPQGKQSLVSSIGMTERLNLFRQQALTPYKRALWIMAVVLVLAVGGLVTWNILQAKKFDAEIQAKQEQIEVVQQNLNESDELIEALSDELVNTQQASAIERARIQKKLVEAQAAREQLIEEAKMLNDGLQVAVDAAADAGQDVANAQAQIKALQNRLDEAEAAAEAEARAKAEAEARAKAEAEAGMIKHYGEEKQGPTSSSTTKGGFKHY